MSEIQKNNNSENSEKSKGDINWLVNIVPNLKSDKYYEGPLKDIYQRSLFGSRTLENYIYCKLNHVKEKKFNELLNISSVAYDIEENAIKFDAQESFMKNYIREMLNQAKENYKLNPIYDMMDIFKSGALFIALQTAKDTGKPVKFDTYEFHYCLEGSLCANRLKKDEYFKVDYNPIQGKSIKLDSDKINSDGLSIIIEQYVMSNGDICFKRILKDEPILKK